jgi:hypothetical protein
MWAKWSLDQGRRILDEHHTAPNLAIAVRPPRSSIFDIAFVRGEVPRHQGGVTRIYLPT